MTFILIEFDVIDYFNFDIQWFKDKVHVARNIDIKIESCLMGMSTSNDEHDYVAANDICTDEGSSF